MFRLLFRGYLFFIYLFSSLAQFYSFILESKPEKNKNPSSVFICLYNWQTATKLQWLFTAVVEMNYLEHYHFKA